MSHNLYLFCVWVHLLAVCAWVGGMFFLALILLPALRRQGPSTTGQFLQNAAPELRRLGAICLTLLGVTGFAQMAYRGLAWNANPWISSKIGLYGLLVVLSIFHDFWLGPKAGQAMARSPFDASTLKLRTMAQGLGRLTGLLALLMMALGVVIVRGAPH